MPRYRKIDVRIWNDAKFRELDNLAKLVFFLLLTHPNMSLIGTLRGSKESLAYEIGVTPDAMAHAMTDVISHGMAHVDEMGLIFIPNFLKYNPPTSPQSLKNWDDIIENLPECDLKNEVCDHVLKFVNENLSTQMREKLNPRFFELVKNQSDSDQVDAIAYGIAYGIQDGMAYGTTRAHERARSPNKEQGTRNKNINTNKQQTEICNEGSAEEEVVCSEDSVSIFDEPLSEQLNQLAIQQTNKVVDDPNAIIDPVQAIGIARTHGIKLPRTIDLENVCKRKILPVDNMRQCIRLAKRQGNSKGIYVIGIMKNAVNEPSQYHTEEYKTSQRVTLDDVDPNYVFGSEK